MKRFIKIAGVLLVGILGNTGLFYFIENRKGARAWTEEQARLQQRGEPMTLEEMLPPAPAPADNFAAIPLFEGLFEYQPVQGPDGKTRQQWMGKTASARLGEKFQLLPASRFAGKRKAQSEFGETPAIDLTETAAQFQGTTNFPKVPSTGTPAQQILTALESRKAILDELKAASSRPACRFGVRHADLYDAMLPQLSCLKSAGQLLQIRAVAQLETGNRAAAAEDIRLILRLADAAGSDPLLICMLVRLSIETQAASAFWQGWRDQRWTPEDYQRFQATFEAIQSREAAITSLRSERIFGAAIMDQIARERSTMARILASSADPSKPISDVGFYMHLIPTGWIRQNQVIHSRWLDGSVERAEEAPPGMGLSPMALSVDRDLPGPTSHTFLARMLAPAVRQTFKKLDRSLVRCLLVSTTCAIERYRAETGHLPATLADLAPRYLKIAPVDPMDGKPLRYQARSDGHFEIYSVGLDGIDDDGAGSSGPGKEPKDWAWPGRLPRTDSHTL